MATYSVGFIAPKIRAEANHIMIQHWKNICREFTCRSSLESSLSVHIYIKLCNKVNCKTVEAFLDTSTTSICTLALAVASIYCNCLLFEYRNNYAQRVIRIALRTVQLSNSTTTELFLKLAHLYCFTNVAALSNRLLLANTFRGFVVSMKCRRRPTYVDWS